MATDKHVLKNVVFSLGGLRLSTAANSLTPNFEAPPVDASCFEDPANRYLKGPVGGSVTFSGGATCLVEEQALDRLAAAEDPCEPLLILLNSGGAVGSFAMFFEATAFKYQRSGQRGSLAEFSLECMAQGLPYGGPVLYNNLGTPGLTASGVGAAIDLGRTLGPGEKLVVSLHVVNPPGVTGTSPTLDVELESDIGASFAAPVSRASFSQVLGEPAAEQIVLDGDTDPITPHTFYRPRFTVSGTGGVAYYVLMALAIVTEP
ncbi:MAG: hypothetical protein AAF604_04575 [Acidobacteriota bacterium]